MYSFETRSIDRDSLFIMADIVFADAEDRQRVTVRNLSAGGMMVEREMRVKRGQRVTVDLRNIGTVAGVVVWVRSPAFGIAFEREIDPKLARTALSGGPSAAPAYTRPALAAVPQERWSGKLRRV